MSPARTTDDLPLPEITHYRQHRRAAKTYQQLGGIRIAPEEQPSVFRLEHLEAAKRAVPAPLVRSREAIFECAHWHGEKHG